MWDIALHRWLKVPYTLHVGERRRVKNPRATILFIHGIGTSSAAWDDVISRLPNDLNVISIDLLGFGQSPRPGWTPYSVKTQAYSVVATLIKLRLDRRLIIVGHSLGALVAVEVARRYPLIVKSLILCSPPFYSQQNIKKRPPGAEEMLKRLYKIGRDHPEEFVKVSLLARRYGLINKAFDLTSDNVSSYMSALEASIINQTSLADAKVLKKPMMVLHGSLDPVVLKRNLKELKKANPQTTLSTVLAGHEVQGRYVEAVVAAIDNAAERKL